MLLFLAWLLAAPPGQTPAAGGPTLSVPFLPQTEALCGGAAAAMVFRFFGDRHADVQQFAPLVDREAGGISTGALTDAIRARGWNAAPAGDSIEALTAHVARGQPIILLIEDRPARYHFVVVVHADAHSVVVHDPAWGPSRRYTPEALLEVWAPARFWGLVVTPDQTAARDTDAAAGAAVRNAPIARELTPCERRFEEAMDEISARGSGAAETILERVRQQCPMLAAPVRELAGVRFSERRWQDAETLAEEAVALDRTDRYAWDVVASSRFMLNDPVGALDAWNRIDRPQIDRVEIHGLHRTRYSLLAQYVGLTSNTRLTSEAFRLADRRVAALPDRASSRVSIRPEADGYAVVDVNLVERGLRPHGWGEWTARAAATAIDREVAIALPGPSGQGELWSAAWRWWDDRPRVAGRFAAPVSGFLDGVWHANLSWEAQTYATETAASAVREERTSGDVGVARWLTPSLRLDLAAGLEAWAQGAKHARFSAAIERRDFSDRLTIAVAGTRGAAVNGAPSFSHGSVVATARTTTEPRRLVALASARFEAASRDAPLAYWPGAGEGRARPGRLRGHELLIDDTISGPVFGRRVGVVNLEAQHWFERFRTVPVGAAVFVDSATAADRLPGAHGKAFQIDAGAGLRLRLPGYDAPLRIDYGRGLRDGSDSFSVNLGIW